MSGLKLNYLASLVFLFIFGISFFTLDLYMPSLRKWKSSKMLFQSKVYLDESIADASDLLEDGIRKAKLASLLDPENNPPSILRQFSYSLACQFTLTIHLDFIE
jgi:hypothetical protein